MRVRKEQCDLRRGRGRVNQIFVVCQMCEKYLAKSKDVYRGSWIRIRPTIN